MFTQVKIINAPRDYDLKYAKEEITPWDVACDLVYWVDYKSIATFYKNTDFPRWITIIIINNKMRHFARNFVFFFVIGMLLPNRREDEKSLLFF